jgi:hypothetical protein
VLQQKSGNTNRCVARIRCDSEIHRGRLLEAVRLPMALPTSIPGDRCLLQATCMDGGGVFGGEGQLVVKPDGVLILESHVTAPLAPLFVTSLRFETLLKNKTSPLTSAHLVCSSM